MKHSDLLESKKISAHEELWRVTLEFEQELPDACRLWILQLMVRTPQELEEFREKSTFKFSIEDEDFQKVMGTLRDLRRVRPFVEDGLLNLVNSKIVLVMRLLSLLAEDSPTNIDLTHWPEDKIVVENLRKGFTDKEIAQMNFSLPGAYKEVMEAWDTRIAGEIRNALFGSS